MTIPFNFEYYKPETAPEAVDTFLRLEQQGKTPKYYGGGTELISMGRVHNIIFGGAVDIKGIPECNVLQFNDRYLVIGAGVPLTEITESNFFPFPGQAGGRVADHTMQRKITLGGNLAGSIIYRETSLPLLLCESQAVIAGPRGNRQVPLAQVFNRTLNLGPAEFLLQILVEREYTTFPYIHVKKVKQDKIDYPLLTLGAIAKDGQVRLAFSGLLAYPFRSPEMEGACNNPSLSRDERIDQAVANLPAPLLSDMLGSAAYREFVLRNTLGKALETLEDQL